MPIQKDWKLIISLCIIAVVWGTTYLGIRIAVHSVPPWFVTGIRQSIASLLLLGILLYQKKWETPNWEQLKTQLILSSLMIVIANGMTTIAETQITSSLASLLSATTPIIVFLGSVAIKIQKFTYQALIGVILGFCGVVFIFWDGLQDLLNPDYRNGIFALFIAILGWATGTVYTKKTNVNQTNITQNLFIQFSWAAVVQLIFAFVFSSEIAPEKWTWESISAIVYLAVFGSVIAFYAFLFALKRVSATQISILNYINTIIAIFLGWLILNEEISLNFLVAAVFIITGVFITNYKKGVFKRG